MDCFAALAMTYAGAVIRGRLPPFFFYLAGYEYRFLCLYEVVAEECR